MKFLADMGISPTTNVIHQYGGDLKAGAIISVTDGLIRVRRLPIGASH